ncbi:teicoplanin resistance protein VanZ [Mameliella alba]|uniref:teicoplanin resistance protein VanZ n=1 Tax=Mameliella alba TaxID=561184 RepID=UPI001621B637|nr:teicoplanin resistance protein VanZ [Mameliella alba]
MISLLAMVTTLTIGPKFDAINILFGDKVQHAIGFGSIVVPAALFRPRWLGYLAPAVILFGGLIEGIQMFTGREGSLSDWIANIVGICIACGTCLIARAMCRGLWRHIRGGAEIA